MFQRNSKTIAGSNSLKRKQLDEFLDKTIAGSSSFVDDDKRDLEYKPSPKKLKKKPTYKKKSSNSNNLTPKQRIQRLNQKINSKRLSSTTTSQNGSKNSNVDACNMKRTEAIASSNIFDKKSIQEQHLSNDESNAEHYAEYFINDDVQIIPIADDDNLAEILHQTANGSIEMSADTNTTGVDISNTKPNRNTHNSDPFVQSADIARMLASVNEKLGDMNGEILALRRQVARLEAKSTINQKSNAEFDDNLFLEFDSALAAEGLPIKTVQGVNELEKRLKATAFSVQSFRQKLEFIYIYISY